MRLAPALVFDHPTPEAVARFLTHAISNTIRGPGPGGADDGDIRDKIASIPLPVLRESGLLDQLVALAEGDGHLHREDSPTGRAAISEMDTATLIRLAHQTGSTVDGAEKHDP